MMDHVKDKKLLMEQIAQCEFICIDINLYLDTHPDDENALADYNCYAEQLEALKAMYVEHYGPLANFGNSVSYGSWKWTSNPWPFGNCKKERPRCPVKHPCACIEAASAPTMKEE